MSSFFSKKNVAVRTGLEPATLGVTGRYSNQLNYRTLMILIVRLLKKPFPEYLVSQSQRTTEAIR